MSFVEKSILRIFLVETTRDWCTKTMYEVIFLAFPHLHDAFPPWFMYFFSLLFWFWTSSN
jgi:hypothetical protein